MKYRDKLIKYFEDAPEGAVIVANDMYENGFTKMSHVDVCHRTNVIVLPLELSLKMVLS